MAATDWSPALKPLLKKYKGRRHPLEYKDIYQLVVMVILSAQDSDKHINAVVPPFFQAYPNLQSLANASEETLLPYLGKVRGHRKKISWILNIARTLKVNKNIPLTMQGLTALPGIGRKSANVIMREAGVKTEGVMVDLHVVRVAPRLGIASGTDPKKIEQQIMEALPQKDWSEAGMAISFLGRETCRPTHPEHHDCVVRAYCEYFTKNAGKQPQKEIKKPAKKGAGKASAPRPVKSKRNKPTSLNKKKPAK